MSPKADVIIIGAGLAGLRAAAWIGRLGYKVLVLEAKEEVGGRIKTFYNQHQIPIEMGSNLVTVQQPPQKSVLSAYMQQAELTLMPIDIDHSDTFDSLQEHKKIKKLFLVARDYYHAAELKIKTAKKKAIQETIEKKGSITYPSLSDVLQFTEQTPKINSPLFIGQQTLIAMIKQHTGSSPEKISLAELLNDDGSLQQTYFVQGGFQSLPNLIAREAAETGNVFFQLNTPITEIHRDVEHHGVTVIDCRGKQYHADYAICTLPVGVLKANNVRFSPPLSAEKQKLFKHLHVGHQNKVVLEFEYPFWPMDVHYLFPGSQNVAEWPEYLNLSHFSDKKNAILIAHYYGEAAKFGHRKDPDIVQMALAPLQKVFGSKMSPLRSCLVTRWDTDPYASGTTSCFGTAFRQKDLALLTTPEPGGLYFAGAYTLSNTHRETLAGASISGLRTAVAISAKLSRYRHRTRYSLSLPLKNRPHRR